MSRFVIKTVSNTCKYNAKLKKTAKKVKQKKNQLLKTQTFVKAKNFGANKQKGGIPKKATKDKTKNK